MPLNGQTKVVGVFGWPVKHSLSPPMQQAAFDALGLNWAYLPFAVKPENLEAAARALPALGIVGVNCTIPHKEAIAAIVDEIDPEAKAIGAVNTVTVLEDGRLHGMNTDADGFLESLRVDGKFEPKGKIVSLLGTGGAGRAMAFALARAGVKKLNLINRTVEKAERLSKDLSEFGIECEVSVISRESDEAKTILGETELLVNSTSLGLKEGDPLPADPALLPEGAAVYDAVYTPLETPLLLAASKRDLRTIPGLGMLARQGARSFEHWTGQAPDVDLMIDTLKRALKYA
jgi:shikimate dehydrogenase